MAQTRSRTASGSFLLPCAASWDQGEKGTSIAGEDHTAVMTALMRSWLSAWGDDELPFFLHPKNQPPAIFPQEMAMLLNTFSR